MKLFNISALALAGGLSCLAAPINYSFQFVNYPGDTFTQLLGINNSGTIAGYHGAAINQGFTLTLPASFTNENFPGSVQTQVVGINSAGDTVGFYVDAAGNQHGFIDVGGLFKTVDNPLGDGTVNQLLGYNDHGIAAGYYAVGANQFAETWDSAANTFAPVSVPAGSPIAQATGLNNAAWISGFYQDAAGNTHGFLTNGTTFNTLDAFGSSFTQALGVNNLNQVVGTYNDAGGNANGFVYSGGMFQTVDVPGASMTVVNGTNDKGQIVGFFVDGAGNTVGFVGTPTPEPSSFIMAGLGALALGLLRRRSRREI